MMLLFSYDLWSHIGLHHAKAMMTPVGFDMLDRVPQKRPADPQPEEDAMAVKKSAA